MEMFAYQINQQLSIVADHIELSGCAQKEQQESNAFPIETLQNCVEDDAAECGGRGEQVVGQHYAEYIIEFLMQTKFEFKFKLRTFYFWTNLLNFDWNY